MYKLSKAKLSQFDRTRGDKNQIFPILDKMDEIKVGVTYIKNGAALEHFPSCEQVNPIF